MDESRIRYFLGMDFFENEKNPLNLQLAGIVLSQFNDATKLTKIVDVLNEQEFIDGETIVFLSRLLHGHYGSELEQLDLTAEDFITFWEAVYVLCPHAKVKYLLANLRYIAGASIDEIGLEFIEAMRADPSGEYSIGGDVSEELYASKHAFEYHLVLFEKMARHCETSELEAERQELIEEWGDDPIKLERIEKVFNSIFLFDNDG